MNLEAGGVPGDSVGFLKACLVDGDRVLRSSAQASRRQALLLSILLQSVTVAAIIILPLLGRSERIAIPKFVERPLYRRGSAPPETPQRAVTAVVPARPCLYCKQSENRSKPIVPSLAPTSDPYPSEPGIPSGPNGTPTGIPGGNDRDLQPPAPPAKLEVQPKQTARVTIAHIDPAQLLRRIEPRYPTMGVHLRRETRVELEAVIATDGRIESLQVLSGDPVFYQSALEAVREWRYTPTILNGQPVEVDTHISVIYTLNR